MAGGYIGLWNGEFCKLVQWGEFVVTRKGKAPAFGKTEDGGILFYNPLLRPLAPS